MTIRLGDTSPDFAADNTHGCINFYERLGDPWCVLFSHPKDFSPSAPPSSVTSHAAIHSSRSET
jgi:alkyl hydroperoxide reductase subunit AhpC